MTGFSKTSKTPKKVGLREQNPEKGREGGPGCCVTQEAAPSLGRAAEQCASMQSVWKKCCSSGEFPFSTSATERLF